MNNKWRLPTIQELLSIVDYTKYNPATNLEGIKSNWYWSSSSSVPDSSLAWGVDLEDGDSGYSNKKGRGHIRCVRTLDDSSLEWAKEDAPTQMNWQKALDYAESLNVEQRQTIVLETWLVKSLINDGGLYTTEGTQEFFERGFNKVKLLSTREVEI